MLTRRRRVRVMNDREVFRERGGGGRDIRRILLRHMMTARSDERRLFMRRGEIESVIMSGIGILRFRPRYR